MAMASPPAPLHQNGIVRQPSYMPNGQFVSQPLPPSQMGLSQPPPPPHMQQPPPPPPQMHQMPGPIPPPMSPAVKHMGMPPGMSGPKPPHQLPMPPQQPATPQQQHLPQPLPIPQQQQQQPPPPPPQHQPPQQQLMGPSSQQQHQQHQQQSLPSQPQPPNQQIQPPPPNQEITAYQKLENENVECWLSLGKVAELMGDFDRAVASYDSSLRHNNYYIPTLTAIANLYRSREMFPKAIEYYLKIIELNPTSGETWGSLGKFLSI